MIELVERVARALGGEGEAAVLEEAAVVDEVGDVLARRALAGPAAAGDGVGARRVGGGGEAGAQLGQLGADDLVIAHGDGR